MTIVHFGGSILIHHTTIQPEKTLVVTHNAGFFSCSTQRLRRTIDFFNDNKVCPDVIDSSQQFGCYKTNQSDLTEYFYRNNDEVAIDYDENIFFTELKGAIDHHDQYIDHHDQYMDYKLLNYEKVIPFVKKYFKPSEEVDNKIISYEDLYNFDYDNLCSIFYRGNDKKTETRLGSHQEYIDKCAEVKEKNLNMKFFVQTDDARFLSAFLSVFNDSIYIEDIPRIEDDLTTVHFKLPQRERLTAAINFLAATHIVSKCNTIITHSGNCGLWAILFRGNSDNVIQYLNGVFCCP